MDRMVLRQAEKIEITSLVDNYSDVLLPDGAMVKRMRVLPPDSPLAEHGLACLISVYSETEHHTILMDAGISGTCIQHNARLLSISVGAQRQEILHCLDQVEAVVLSHGHFDHFSGLPAYLHSCRTPMPLVVHPGAFVDRRAKLGPDLCQQMPPPSEKVLEQAGAVITKRAAASTVGDDFFLVTGAVERVTGFETGAPYLEAKMNDQWVLDPFNDDQGVAIALKHKGLVVIGGCSHSGIINMVQHALRVTGSNRVYAVLGGFHLTGADDVLIFQTIAELKKIDPRIIVPMHCTGWKAINAIANAMPEAFILNSVGTTYLFES